jgi:Ribonuclease G/E
MTKELFVSSTPHETKVGLVEDDLLAEVYLERENEYTLAGSIYKGRVTRVLPGMQSAFVDIGLERDAFLYVSDFMELENQDEDLDEVPIAGMVPDLSVQPQGRASEGPEEQGSQRDGHPRTAPAAQQPAAGRDSSTPREDRDRGSYRGRRRRGRREQFPPRPAQAESRPEREQYGPPPGYQPMILPGESISKYRGRGQAATANLGVADETHSLHEETPSGVSQSFPQDEPLF